MFEELEPEMMLDEEELDNAPTGEEKEEEEEEEKEPGLDEEEEAI